MRNTISFATAPSAFIRTPAALPNAANGFAEALPFDKGAFDACMATVTVHQWSDWRQGLAEMRRVARDAVLILGFDPDALDQYWLAEYAPELICAEFKRYQPIAELSAALGGACEVTTVPIPFDCVDGFTEAFYGRPERFLDAEVRRSQSACTFITEEAQTRAVDCLREDLKSGKWDTRHGALRKQPFYQGSLRLIVSRRLQTPDGEAGVFQPGGTPG